MRLPADRDRTCSRCGDPDPLPLGHHCWDHQRGRAAILRALRAADPPMVYPGELWMDALVDDILRRLAGDALIPRQLDPKDPR